MDGDIIKWIPVFGALIAAVALIIVTVIQVNSKKKQGERDKRDAKIESWMETISEKLINNDLKDVQHKTDYHEFKTTTNRRLDKIEDKIDR